MVHHKTFPDGEQYLRIESNPADRDIVLRDALPIRRIVTMKVRP